jgi:hypothetical protein
MLSELVTAEIRERFPPSEVAAIRAALSTARLPVLPEPRRWRDRILLALLVVADGDLGEFQRALRRAESDWRDVLMEAGLGHADWPEELARRGYCVPE